MYARVAQRVLTHSNRGIFRRVAGIEQVRIEREFLHFVSLTSGAVTKVCLFWMLADFRFFAQVGEWLKPTDCKSVPPSEVRRFESFPVHQFEADEKCA